MRKLFSAALAFVGAIIVPAVAHAGSVNIPNVSVPHVPHVTTPNTRVVTPQALGTKVTVPKLDGSSKDPNYLKVLPTVNPNANAGGGVWIDPGAPVMVAPDGRKYPVTTTRTMTRPPQ